jgi:hypothetical protein
MSESSQTTGREFTREQEMAALFAHMVMQQTNMAMMLLGKMPHPETGETLHDIDSARLFIDQLEMLEVKTKGNLSKQEEGLLKQSLMNLRLAFVEVVDKPPAEEKTTAASEQPKASSSDPAPPPPAEATSASQEEESKKKFSKKY